MPMLFVAAALVTAQLSGALIGSTPKKTLFSKTSSSKTLGDMYAHWVSHATPSGIRLARPRLSAC